MTPPAVRWLTPEPSGWNIPLAETGPAALAEGVRQGLHRQAQLAVVNRQGAVFTWAMGSSGPPTNPAPLRWYSAGKPLAVAALAWLLDRGKGSLNDRIAHYLPEFSPAGDKDAVTLRHLLTHTGGFPETLGELSLHTSWAETLAHIGQAPAEHPPGTVAAYQREVSWLLLSEVIQRMDGRPLARLLAEEFFSPLGMTNTYLESSPFPRPGSGWQGPALDLALFYGLWLNHGRVPAPQGPAILDPRTVELFTACHRWGMPDRALMNAPLAWGLGFALHGHADFPRQAGRRVFGHPGLTLALGLADPDRGLAAVVLTDGEQPPALNARRMREALDPVFLAAPGGRP
ncbi:MAG: beta-lactamase family protein [Deltaproteobacteria bacterium]|nr:beta-lactamase family protein [Deltaproteobacteria bacterium]